MPEEVNEGGKEVNERMGCWKGYAKEEEGIKGRKCSRKKGLLEGVK